MTATATKDTLMVYLRPMPKEQRIIILEKIFKYGDDEFNERLIFQRPTVRLDNLTPAQIERLKELIKCGQDKVDFESLDDLKDFNDFPSRNMRDRKVKTYYNKRRKNTSKHGC